MKLLRSPCLSLLCTDGTEKPGSLEIGLLVLAYLFLGIPGLLFAVPLLRWLKRREGAER